MKKWLIVGATSAIAEATVRVWATRGYSFYLAARDTRKLEIVRQDLQSRGAVRVETGTFAADQFDQLTEVFDQAKTALDGLDGILIAYGTLPDQLHCEQDLELAQKEIRTNALSVIHLCGYAANYFEHRKTGTIAVITSVAGDRGRKSNYVYGAAKGMVGIFLQGLRNRLSSCGVSVLTIKPGFVDTPMTHEFDKTGPLWAQPEIIGEGIAKAVDKRRNVVYLPWFWSFIMLIIKSVPEVIFKRLSL
ncbi:Predicted oxidoreductase, short-chain dehydrogenase/reductase family [gamma proteobacterium HdN1]|nr:Predicted oxidoreductase, short-chain dehydrogenase/reductase family [gamma proteobacterium HdN1]